MALELRQQLKLAQKLVMTPQLRQAIKLLQLNRLDLSTALQAEIEQNPALEIETSAEDGQDEPSYSLSTTAEPDRTNAPETDFTPLLAASDALPDTNWEEYANNFDSNFSFSKETPPADAPSQFDFISEKPGLSAYLQWQLAHSELDEREWEIALYIVGNLNRYGFLETTLEDIIENTNCTFDEADYLLEVVQELDPPGIAARNVSESLKLQLERINMGKSLAAQIVTDHLNLLETRNYKMLSRLTGRKKSEIVEAINFITANLTPFPGLPYAEEATNYIVPDVYVEKIDGEYVIKLNDDDLPKLKVSSYYQDLLQATTPTTTKESKTYIADKVKSAEWFIRSIHQRQRTIYRVMESILRFQHDFFDNGPAALKPLILRDVAEDIGMHESTISRVTSNKYAHTPQGIIELKYFFSTAIPREGGDALAAESIKTRIRQMIQEEDKTKPLSDSAIAELLADRNIQLARRTVAKYREQMKIPPVKHRRQTN
ncbi:RNA polymerase factor sigma-54 [Desulfofustis glycolicus]|uniref:RNA polymerase, sigma 54 subunit, RpoN/SigL n=1 Tax=Desulfofustis glycolicus DSM 9705 TaxID=1121409 RepID=A0A1M5Y6Y0_9BACT|nr:RNA polymerase factor sigma-54 [Desulfofustis glycolicus]MCB2216871.1 RNA polymerase factor sigma-54 [Desulfobulbaceae bacterium]SHI07817.1 RNA polymerase, sigma 54 subunit, RpoN/SigL [Desulfofustis glycolicus DSM 9705]